MFNLNHLTLIYFSLQGLFLHPNKAAPESAALRKYFYFGRVLVLFVLRMTRGAQAPLTTVYTDIVFWLISHTSILTTDKKIFFKVLRNI